MVGFGSPINKIHDFWLCDVLTTPLLLTWSDLLLTRQTSGVPDSGSGSGNGSVSITHAYDSMLQAQQVSVVQIWPVFVHGADFSAHHITFQQRRIECQSG